MLQFHRYSSVTVVTKLRAFPPLRRVQTSSGAHIPLYPVVSGALSQGIKWQEREADNSFLCSAGIKECTELFLLLSIHLHSVVPN
jgi:hypothetical protein